VEGPEQYEYFTAVYTVKCPVRCNYCTAICIVESPVQVEYFTAVIFWRFLRSLNILQRCSFQHEYFTTIYM